ncbi:DUF4390 domain-containing protein [Methylotenera sp. N17]|jgi:hypothetical protein|uniref:DUF4390 domain-containing protein n=1 Tax=Methylotenera sp. N17 TaxID=1502761 RepID=UPI000648BA5F|nr:DUF4390 domain-containing protein [Methylotenera sp. N17]
MRFCKKFSIFFSLLAVSWYAFAAANSINVKSAELTFSEDVILLNADFDISFGPSIEEAINKGVPLTFLVEFQIVEPRQYWFDDEIVTVSKPIQLSYHALTRQYLVSYDVHQKSFESLHEARQQLAVVRDWRVAVKSQLEKSESYRAALLMRLDKGKLPKAIQVDAISSENWNLASPIYSWPVKDLK